MENFTKTIFVIEDDKGMSSVYETFLRKEGFNVEVAFDGEQALQKLTSLKPDLIILDIVLPKIDGLTVLKRIKENEALKKVPVLVATNLNDKSQIDQSVALGANDYIIKTNITLDYLLLKIKSIVD